MHIYQKIKILFCPYFFTSLCIFYGRTLNIKIGTLYERALRAYIDYISSFEIKSDKNNSVTIHDKNLLLLATEMFKIDKKLLSNPICITITWQKMKVDKL